MRAKLEGIAIAGVVCVVPSAISRFDDEVANYSHDPANTAKLKEMMGYDEHRVVAAGVTAADLASVGLKRLFDDGIVDASTVGALIFVSQTPDYQLPPTSAVLHGRFDFGQHCYCIDINDGCNGFIKGLFEAGAFLSTSDQHTALLVTADALSARVSKRDRNSYPLIGDAAAITIVRKRPDAPGISLRIEYDGRGADALVIPAGGARLPASSQTAVPALDSEGNWRASDNLVMQGRDVFAFTQRVVPGFIESFVSEVGRTLADFDYFFLHQANAFILDRIRRKLKLDEVRLPDRVIRRYGNSSSATIPMGIALHADANRTVNVLLCGFGVGLSWGAASAQLKDLQICEVMEMNGP